MEHILIALTLLTTTNSGNPYVMTYEGRQYVYQALDAYQNKESCNRALVKAAKENPKLRFICTPRDYN